jgi:hypothetical protein
VVFKRKIEGAQLAETAQANLKSAILVIIQQRWYSAKEAKETAKQEEEEEAMRR